MISADAREQPSQHAPGNGWYPSAPRKLLPAQWKTSPARVRVLITVPACLLIAGLLTSCAAPLSTDVVDEPPVAVSVAPAAAGSISASSVYVARVEARNQVDLVPLATGRIQQLNVDVGSEVREGQLIAELGHETLDAELQQAQAALRNAEANLARLRSEVEPNRTAAQARADAAKARLEQLLSPSPRDLEVAASAVNKAQAELEAARTELDQLEDPTDAQIVAAQAAVAKAESELSQAQVGVNQAIDEKLQARNAK